MLKLPNFKHVKVVIVSMVGACHSRIKRKFVLGRLQELYWRHILKDHSGQEAEFSQSSSLRNRTIVARPTSLIDNTTTGVGTRVTRLVQFGDRERLPTFKTGRTDLAAWIVYEVMAMSNAATFAARIVNLTRPKDG